MISREDALGLLFYARVFQLFNRWRAYHKIWSGIREEKNPFSVNAWHTEWRRAEQRILYGRTLTKAQCDRIDALNLSIGISKADIVKLIYAQAVSSNGNLHFKKRSQIILAALGIINAALACIWILATSHALITQSGANWQTISAAIAILLLIPGLSALYFAYCGVAPLRALGRVKSSLKCRIKKP
mgnify:CR=1 FL=1